MEKRFHLFVRHHPQVGYSVTTLADPRLTAFASDVEEARAELQRTLAQRLAKDPHGLGQETTHWPGTRLKRIDTVLRAMQFGRILEVPLRVTALLHPLGEEDAKTRPSAVLLRIPRLHTATMLENAEDAEALVEELLRSRLSMQPIETLLSYSYDGEETIESLTVPYRPAATKLKQNKNRREHLPSELVEVCRSLGDEHAPDRAFEREFQLAELTQLLTTRRRGILLLGPRGSGKTALVQELAHRARESNENAPLHGREFWSTSGSRIIAGMRWLGQWQERLGELLETLDERNAVLHIESLAELCSLMSGHSSGMDPARFLLTALESGTLTLLTEAREDELAALHRSHAALLKALEPVHVQPLSLGSSLRALEQLAHRLGREGRVHFTQEALLRAIELTERFNDGSALPGAAIALLRTTMQENAPDEEGSRYERTTIGPEELVKAFSVRTGYPRELVDPNVPLDPDAVLERLRSRVMGQDNAMLLLRDLIVTLKAGLSDTSKPLGSFLLLGPTGVGKTESALSLTEYLFGSKDRLARFDMAEYAAPGSAQRLIGGYGGEGSLAQRVSEQPFGVVLLDEIEKAEQGVLDLLLQVLGEGRLSDAGGRTISFRNTIVLLTSNLGAESVGRSLGFRSESVQSANAHYLRVAADFFRPELLNRIDHVVPYHPLGADTVRAIAERAIRTALDREGFTRRGIHVQYSDEVVRRVAMLGFDPRYGARPLKRAIERWIIAPLARVLSARGARAPKTLELIVRSGGIAVAPTSASEVALLEPELVKEELTRRASQASARAKVELRVQPEQSRARRRARWLAEKYEQWCKEHGAIETQLLSNEEGFVLRCTGGPAALLAFEAGKHEFFETGETTSVLVQSVDTPHAERNARLFTDVPERSVLDTETELEFVGSWDSACEGSALDRFVLARVATMASIG